jgi:hypothetical protein
MPRITIFARGFIADCTLYKVSKLKIGYLPKHAFIGNDSKGEKIDCKGVILPINDLRCHIARSSTCILVVLVGESSCDSEIGNAEIAFLIEN